MEPDALVSLTRIKAVLLRGTELRDRESGVDLLRHAMNCGQAALRDGLSEFMVVAALCHDIGHFLGDPADETLDAEHPHVGERWLSSYFPHAVTRPIGLHVEAKRYWASASESYLAGLGDGSRRSLDLQGGPMTPGEAARFEIDPHFADALTLRAIDDRRIQRVDISFDDFLPHIAACLRKGPRG